MLSCYRCVLGQVFKTEGTDGYMAGLLYLDERGVDVNKTGGAFSVPEAAAYWQAEIGARRRAALIPA